MNEGSSWNIISTRRKKNYHWQESLKNKIKIVSTSQKISLPLARISSFFKTVSPPNSNNGFHWQKNSSNLKVLFPLDRKFVSTSRMKDLLKNVLRLYGKIASTLKNLKISENIEKTDVHQQEYILFLKIDFPMFQ